MSGVEAYLVRAAQLEAAWKKHMIGTVALTIKRVAEKNQLDADKIAEAVEAVTMEEAGWGSW